jgi:hypothetical protein
MSVCAKVMSRGVHNIAFSLSPDGFWASDLGNEPESGLKIKEGGGLLRHLSFNRCAAPSKLDVFNPDRPAEDLEAKRCLIE